MASILALIGAISLAFNPLFGASSVVPPSGYFIDLDLVQRIECKQGTDTYSGTGWFYKDQSLVTAAHVVEGMNSCTIQGKTVTVTKLDHDADYALLTVESHPSEVLSFTCEPFHKDAKYFAVGYALGEDFVVQPLRGSIENSDDESGFRGESLLVGKSFAGMSGGPIFNEAGQVVGLVNGGDKEGRSSVVSRSLVDTTLCGK